jgi:hypothetical protein
LEYSYQQLVEDLHIGHEIEFLFSNKKYSFSNNESGWFLTVFGEEQYQSFCSVSSLLEQARIEGKSIEEIWIYVNVTSIF